MSIAKDSVSGRSKLEREAAAKHTPGPWEAREYDGVAFVGPPRPDKKATVFYVAKVIDPEFQPGDLMANARLIAAAPGMLSLLERIARGEEFEAHGEICKTDPCLRCEAVELVAKAVP